MLSEAESPLSPEVRNFFRERIIKVLAENAYSVEFATNTSSPVPDLLKAGLHSSSDFLGLSQEMARHLYACQQGWSPGGLLAVIGGTVAERPALAVLKLEKEEGTRIRSDTLEGKNFFSVEHVKDLILTGKTKIFKVGLFTLEATDEVTGLACDQQRPPTDSVALFFLHKFLGCVLEELAEVSTQRFFQTAERFLNATVDDPSLRARYELALLSEMNSEADRIRPDRFAQDHLQVRHRDAFVRSMRDADLPPSFPKNVDLVRNRLPKVQLSFERGVAILCPPEQLDKGGSVTVEKLADGQARVAVTDVLKATKGHS